MRGEHRCPRFAVVVSGLCRSVSSPCVFRECDLAPPRARVSDTRRELTVWHERARVHKAPAFSPSITLTTSTDLLTTPLYTDTMEKTSLSHGLSAETQLWRPWTNRNGRGTNAYKPYERTADGKQQMNKVPVITHPVKLFWPRSRCFDYLYQDAELLLRNYPVQATICLYEESDSEEEEEEEEKELS